MIKAMGLKPAPAVRLIEPVSYLLFLSLEADARAVLTDSGGVQEETTYLEVSCFTLRDNTERPVTVRPSTNTLLDLAPERIPRARTYHRHPSCPCAAARDATEPPPPWDGPATERVGAVLQSASAKR